MVSPEPGPPLEPTPTVENPPSTPRRGGRLNTYCGHWKNPSAPPSHPPFKDPSQDRSLCPVLVSEICRHTRACVQGHPTAVTPFSVCLFIENYFCRVAHSWRHSHPAQTLLTHRSSHIHSSWGRMFKITLDSHREPSPGSTGY